MTEPLKALDLFCKAGGATKGLQRAGFHVTGVDIEPQKNYCGDEFIQADAMEVSLDGHDFIWASPPCQAYSSIRRQLHPNKDHPDLVAPTRDRLVAWGGSWVIENVEQSPLEAGPPILFHNLAGITLCGSMFGLHTDKHELRRHRLFESNFPLTQPQCQHSDRVVIGFYGDHARGRTWVNGHHARGTDITKKSEKMRLVRDLMDIDWMDWNEAKNAIPPAYSEYIARQFLSQQASSP